MIIAPTAPVTHSWDTLRQRRVGIMLHYDDSGSDAGALEWLTKDPRCEVSYNVLVLDDGQAYEIAPLEQRAWHAGVCHPSDSARLSYQDANSAFYGIAIAAKDGETAKLLQFRSVVELCRQLAAQHAWDLAKEPWRITGHADEAWPRGRKIDPTGSNPLRPVLSLEAVRAAFTSPPFNAAA
ncbi:MAG TPA: N-acetylmuramoyl-L-alanine amidase [Gemmatimonadales bacterium]